jgi:hypothetical protein
MKAKALFAVVAIGALSGCASLMKSYFTANPTCPGRVTDVSFQSGACVTGVEYPAARKKAQRSLREAAESRDETNPAPR